MSRARKSLLPADAQQVNQWAWYYENRGSIEVYIDAGNGISSCRIPFRKLAETVRRITRERIRTCTCGDLDLNEALGNSLPQIIAALRLADAVTDGRPKVELDPLAEAYAAAREAAK